MFLGLGSITLISVFILPGVLCVYAYDHISSFHRGTSHTGLGAHPTLALLILLHFQ